MILQTTIEHGDAVETQLNLLNQKLESEVQERSKIETRMHDLIQVISKEKSDLEIIMRTIIEHGDAVGEQWYNRALDATFLANIDSLTQVANRRRLDDYLADEWQKMAQEQLFPYRLFYAILITLKLIMIAILMLLEIKF